MGLAKIYLQVAVPAWLAMAISFVPNGDGSQPECVVRRTA
jgi:hypothetical protein